MRSYTFEFELNIDCPLIFEAEANEVIVPTVYT